LREVIHVTSKKTWDVGDIVELKIEFSHRNQNSILHSAGHIIGATISDYFNLTPTITNHKKNQSKVSFDAKTVECKTELTKDKVQNLVNNMLNEYKEHPVFNSFSEDGKRQVQIANSNYPCGGTHIEHISDIQSITINKLTLKKDILTVSYDAN
jgi:alanyl-tRNA synthetase